MEYLTAALAVYAVVAFIKYAIDARNDREMIKVNEDVQSDTSGVPLGRRLFISFVSRLYSRLLENEEFYFGRREDAAELEIDFYVARRILFMDLVLPSSQGTKLRKVQFICDNGQTEESFGIHAKDLGGQLKIRVLVPKLPAISKIILFLDQFEVNSSCEVRVGVQRGTCPDYKLIKSALDQFNRANYNIAYESLREYLRMSDKNPHVYQYLADVCEMLKKDAEFEEYLLKAMVYGLGEAVSDRYHQFVISKEKNSVEAVRRVQAQSRDWTPGKHHGIIMLSYEQEYLTGLNDWSLRKVREVMVIRRPVAARMLTKVGFDFQGSEILLHTECRIIKEDDTIIDLPKERFVVGDSEERNIYITTDTEKSASWILPDISAGDIIEFCYHILGREGYAIGDSKVPLALISLIGHPFYPTLVGTAVFKFPRDESLHYGLKDRGIKIDTSNSQEGNYNKKSFAIHRFSPVTNTNYYYSNYYNNPVIACANRSAEWPEISEAVQLNNFGTLEASDTLPSPLQEFIEQSQTPKEAAQKTFYWVRDKLKYASTSSAIRFIGKHDRAKIIIQSGVADCKDKSFLLYLVCKQLKLETQFVAVSYKHSILFEDLPSDQFDHVFVRVRIDGRWYYLDAANRSAVFCSCPPLYQGSDALILNEECGIERIPVDAPEKNKISVTETFDRIDGDWLSGTYHIAASGNVARVVDEDWKARSLMTFDSMQGAQTVLRNFLPRTVLKSFDRISHTSHTDSFEVLGMHNRCQLSRVGNRHVGTLEWNEPTTPIGFWRNFNYQKTFMFYLPTLLEINIIFTGELPDQISDISAPFLLTNELCDIKSETIRRNGEIILSRRIIIKKRFVDPEFLELIPPTMEGIEKAFQAALIIT